MYVMSIAFDALVAASSLLLLSIGLALIFANRGIVNLAHGEFAMVGAYTAVKITLAGGNFITAVLASTLLVGLMGLVVERLVIRRLYHRPADAMLATWGASLLAVQVVTIIFGSTPIGLPIPLGNFAIGNYSKSTYSLVIIGLAIAVVGVLYLIVTRTSFGLRARAVSHDSAIAQAVGIDAGRVDMITFTIGAASAGLAGAVLAPTLGVAPGMGSGFIADVFMTVVVGGANFIVGAPAAALLLGGSDSALSSVFMPIVGQVGLLLIALLIVRFAPGGLSRTSVKR